MENKSENYNSEENPQSEKNQTPNLHPENKSAKDRAADNSQPEKSLSVAYILLAGLLSVELIFLFWLSYQFK